ncbi:MAG: hypothetical protein OXG47_08920 [bacterium]|nr:hypothetical protein [bacterium]
MVVGCDWQDCWADMHPLQIERELRPLVRDVGLVGEIDLALDGKTYGMAKSAVARFIQQRNWNASATDCPAATVIFFVAEGVHRYRGGRFWPNVSIGGIDGPNEQRRVGQAFRVCALTGTPGQVPMSNFPPRRNARARGS